MRSILVTLKNRYRALSDVEKRAADYILAHPAEVAELTIGAFAQRAGVAPSGAVRLCKDLELSGYAELKRSLLKDPALRACVIPDASASDSLSEIFQKVFSSSVRSLQDTLGMLDMPGIGDAVNALAEAKSIHFFGVGTSATIAQDAYYRFMRIGLPAHAEVDSHIMQIAAAQLSAADAAVAISHCGATRDTVETLRIARECGARTIAITSRAESPILAYADTAIVVYSDEIRYPVEAVSARIAHIAVLDALCVALSLRAPERTAARVRTMNELFAKKRSGQPRACGARSAQEAENT